MKYIHFFQHSRDIMLIVRQDGRIIKANDAALKAYRYSMEELMDIRINDLRDPALLH